MSEPGSPRLRVTVVVSGGVVGGAELWLLDLLPATRRLRVDAVALAAGPVPAALAGLGVPVRVLATGPRRRDLARSAARLARELIIRRQRPDLVLANGVKAALVASVAARLAGVRCVWVKHDHSFDGRPMAVLARLVDGVVAASPALAAASGRADAVVVPPPRPVQPPLPRSAAGSALTDLGLKPGPRPATDRHPVLAVVGRLVRYKGVEDAIRALGRPGGGGWRLAVIGAADPAEPGEPARLRALAASAGVSDRVSFLGPVPAAGRLLAGVDAVAVLTKPAGAGPDREGFGTVALEAMVAGVPVIATTGGPVVDRLGAAGLPVPPGDPGAVAAALGRLADPARRAELGAAGTVLAAGHPDAAACADLLVSHLARVACRPGAGLSGGPPLTVVTTVRNEAAATDRLLARLVGQLGPDDEVVVVDAGSVDATALHVKAWADADERVRLLIEPGAGISAGRNAGVRAAGNAHVVCTDAGCDPAPGWLAAFRAALAEREPPGLLTGVYRVPAHGPLQAAMAVVGYPDPAELRHPSLLVRGYVRLFGRGFDATMPTGRSVAFTVSGWRSAGGFPEHLATGEDVLFGRAVVAAGAAAALVADAEVSWRQRPTLAAAARMYHRYGQGSGRSRDPRLLRRDLARAVAYPAAAALALRTRPTRTTGVTTGRAALAAVAAAYLSLPVARLLRRPPDLAAAGGAGSVAGLEPAEPAGPAGLAAPARILALAAVPLAAAVRDLAKATGALAGLRGGAGGASR